MVGLATALLIYLLVGKLWSALDPDSVSIRFGSTFREAVTIAGQIALVVLLGIVVHLVGALLVAYVAAYLILDGLAGLASK